MIADVGYRQSGVQELDSYVARPEQRNDRDGGRRIESERNADRGTAIEGRLIEECGNLSVWGNRGAPITEVAVRTGKKEGDRRRLTVRVCDRQTGVDRAIHLRVDPARLN